MNNWKLARILVGLLFASPMIYITYWGYNASKYEFEATSFNQKVIDGKAKPEDIAEAIQTPFPRLPWQGLLDKSERTRNFNAGALNKERRVTYRTAITLKDVLKPGETPPDPAFEKLWIQARALHHFSERCGEILADLATKCQAYKARLKELSNGTTRITVSFSYVPDYDLGAPVPDGDFEIFRGALASRSYNDAENKDNTSQNRTAALSLSKSICGEIRKLAGNCVIREVNFYSRAFRDDPKRKALQSTALFAVHMIEDKSSRENIVKLIASLTEPG